MVPEKPKFQQETTRLAVIMIQKTSNKKPKDFKLEIIGGTGKKTISTTDIILHHPTRDEPGSRIIPILACIGISKNLEKNLRHPKSFDPGADYWNSDPGTSQNMWSDSRNSPEPRVEKQMDRSVDEAASESPPRR